MRGLVGFAVAIRGGGPLRVVTLLGLPLADTSGFLGATIEGVAWVAFGNPTRERVASRVCQMNDFTRWISGVDAGGVYHRVVFSNGFEPISVLKKTRVAPFDSNVSFAFILC